MTSDESVRRRRPRRRRVLLPPLGLNFDGLGESESEPKHKVREIKEPLGDNTTADRERKYNYIETVIYEAEQKRDKPRLKKNDKGEVCYRCTFGSSGRGASDVKHEGEKWIPIRHFYLWYIRINEDDEVVIYNNQSKVGLQPSKCKICDKGKRKYRGDGGDNTYNKIVEKAEKSAGRKISKEEKKAAADAWAAETYGQPGQPCSFNGGNCLNPDGPNLPWSAFNLSTRQDINDIHHNHCKYCSKASSREGDRWSKYSPDGSHPPTKKSGVTTCSQEGCDETENLENDHCVELNFGGSDKEANQQWLHKKHHDEKKGTIGPNILSVQEVTEDMVSERFHPVLAKAKEEDWSLEKLANQLKIAMEQFLRWKISLPDDELKAFFTSQNTRNNTNHEDDRAVHKFQNWCKQSPSRWNPEHKRYAKKVSGLEVELEFSIDGP